MVFDKEHWRDPRQTIATRYKNDDISYATHGALVAMECVRRLDIPGKQAASMKLLDYGCGTGRMARVLAGYFGHVTAFDPVSECIAEGVKECKIPQVNIAYTDKVDHLPWNNYDVIVSVNVLEHLKAEDQHEMLKTLRQVAKPGALLLLWYSLRTNRKAMQEHLPFGSWIDEDDQWMLNYPESVIQTRVFRL